MADLLEGCISSIDPKRKDYRAFQETFCVRCRNTTCEHALGHKDKFALRTSQQVQRMLHADQANPKQPKYAHLEDFEDRFRQAMQKEIVDKKGDWAVPEVPILDGCQQEAPSHTTSAVDRAVQSLAGTRGHEVVLPEPDRDSDEFIRGAREYMDDEEPPFDVRTEDVAESAGGEVVEPPGPPKPAPTVPRIGNTPVPRGGIIVGKGPTPSRVRLPDSWTPPKSPGTVVKPGGTYQFDKPDEGDNDG